MRINKLQINDFGKFSNKEIVFEDNINVVKGNNESGKSTIQKFIVSMFYGISKDKRKSNFTDYDKYLPWGKESFSGKLSYTLDDGKSFEVFRDFTKKAPTLYNESAEDITKEYSSSKKTGSSFFEEQTGIDEKSMMSSVVSLQGEVAIDQEDENFVIQKIANMAETGDEKISYQAAQKFLTNKRNDDVGTDRTKGRPINVLNEERMELNKEKIELEEYNEEQYSIEEQIKAIQEKKEEDETLLNFANEYKAMLDEQSGMQNKVAIYKETISSNDVKQDSLQAEKNKEEENLKQAAQELEELIKKEEQRENEKNEELKKLNDEKKKKANIFNIVAVILVIISIALFFVLVVVGAVCLAVAIVAFVIGLVTKKKYDKKINEKMNANQATTFEEEQSRIVNIKDKIREAELAIGVIKKSSEEAERYISEIEKKIKESEEKKAIELVAQFKNVSNEKCDSIIKSENILRKIEQLQSEKNNDLVELQKYEYRKKHILPQLERLADVQERLFELDEKEEELSKQADAINLAATTLEEAYQEMKESVVPKFTKNLSDTISKVSSGKYSKVVTNDKEGLLVEKENGEYIPSKALSIGTIDQLYLSLRFSLARELTSQKTPLILDEAFAYYDSERLKNILKYIAEEFADYQVILFTCTSRETELLDEMKINYNLIEI